MACTFWVRRPPYQGEGEKGWTNQAEGRHLRESKCQLCGLVSPQTDRECPVAGHCHWRTGIGVMAESGHRRTRARGVASRQLSKGSLPLRMYLSGRASLACQALSLAPSTVKKGLAAQWQEFSMSCWPLTGLHDLCSWPWFPVPFCECPLQRQVEGIPEPSLELVTLCVCVCPHVCMRVSSHLLMTGSPASSTFASAQSL